MAETIYLVTGHTGEYSDSRDWTVCAYRDEAQAANHAQAAQYWAQAHAAEWQRREYGKRPMTSPYDPWCSIDYTGTRYAVESVEVRQSFDAVATPVESGKAVPSRIDDPHPSAVKGTPT